MHTLLVGIHHLVINKRGLKISVILLGLFNFSSNGALAQADRKDLNVHWDNGLAMTTEDESIHLELGGRMMMDWAFIHQNQDLFNYLGEQPSQSTEFRRLRLYHSGEFHKRIGYKVQFDFAGGKAEPKDVYLSFNDIPFAGKIKVGHYFEPFGLEQNTSSKYITFMERSLTGTFTPGRNPGLSVTNAVFDNRLGWTIGAFKAAGDLARSRNLEKNINLTGRLFGLPVDKGENKLIHLGIEGSYRDFYFDEVTYKSKPETHLAYYYVNTGVMKPVESAVYTNYNLAGVWGPFSLQGEYMTIYGNGFGGYTFNAYYGMLSYMVTGESRNYKKGGGTFGRVQPSSSFKKGEKEGWGALEIAVRYSYLDVKLEPFEENRLRDFSGGLNWYINPNSRIMVNYVVPFLEDKGRGNIVQTRFQVDF